MTRLILTSAFIALVLLGCGKGGFSERSAAGAANTLRQPLATKPTTLDPGRVQDIETGGLLQNVFEGLVAYDENNEIVGKLAESWSLEDGGRTYVFKLREAEFHNGKEVTAEDVKWTLERHASPRFASPTVNYLLDVVGVQEFNDGEADSISGIEVVDDRTVRITLDKPRPYFLGKLTYPIAYILPKGVAPVSEITDPSKAIGTGPFRFDEYARDQVMILAANEKYHGGKPIVEEWYRPIMLDAPARLNKYKANELDLLTLQRQEVPSVQNDPELKKQLRFFVIPTVVYLGMNQNRFPPFKDARVRKAFAMAVDRSRIATDLLGGMPVANGLIPPGIMGHREDFSGLPYDPEQARRLLAEAGYPGGKGFPELRITYREQTPDSRIVAEATQSMLKRNLGIDVRPDVREMRTFLTARNKGELQFYFLSWQGDYLDPENFTSFLLRSDAKQNRDGYRNQEFDRITGAADSTSDPVKRKQLYERANEILVSDAARIPLYFERTGVLVHPRVSGLKTNLFGFLPHTETRVD